MIEGLSGGRQALLMKVHHALVDGMAAIGLAALVLDPSVEPLEIPPAEGDWAPRHYDRRRHVARLAGRQLAMAPRLMVDSMQRALDPDPRRAAAELRRTTELALELARTRPSAPMTPLNRPISPNRRFATRGRRSGGGEAGRTRRRRDGQRRPAGRGRRDARAAISMPPGPPRRLPAAAPIRSRWSRSASGRHPAEGETGNRISTVFVDLPVGEPDLTERIRAISAQTRALKESAAVRAGALMVGAVRLGAPARLRPAGPHDGLGARLQPGRLQHPRPPAAVLPRRRPAHRGATRWCR